MREPATATLEHAWYGAENRHLLVPAFTSSRGHKVECAEDAQPFGCDDAYRHRRNELRRDATQRRIAQWYAQRGIKTGKHLEAELTGVADAMSGYSGVGAGEARTRSYFTDNLDLKVDLIPAAEFRYAGVKKEPDNAN